MPCCPAARQNIWIGFESALCPCTGTWKADKGDAGRIVSNALKAGYRHLDFAMMYGNQAEIGQAMTEVFKEGKVKREDVWMTSKVCRRTPPSLHEI